MGRSPDRLNREIPADYLDRGTATNSSGRGGGGSATEAQGDQAERSQASSRYGNKSSDLRELASVIDAFVADKPTMTEFLQRLERRGIDAIPSIQSSGRLNGISFRIAGKTFKGSELGRAYTAQG